MNCTLGAIELEHAYVGEIVLFGGGGWMVALVDKYIKTALNGVSCEITSEYKCAV